MTKFIRGMMREKTVMGNILYTRAQLLEECQANDASDLFIDCIVFGWNFDRGMKAAQEGRYQFIYRAPNQYDVCEDGCDQCGRVADRLFDGTGGAYCPACHPVARLKQESEGSGANESVGDCGVSLSGMVVSDRRAE